MKKLLYLVMAFCLSPVVNAQRIDLDRESYKHNYRHLPYVIIDNSFQTYSVVVDKTAALDMFTTEKANNRFNIEGRKKVTGKAHFQVNIYMGDLIFESSKIENRVEVKKDKDGNETSRKYYWAEVIYTFEASAEVTDLNGNRLKSYSLEERNKKQTYKTNEFNTSAAASDYYNNNRYEIKSRLAEERINSVVESLGYSLNSDFGYISISWPEKFWTLGSKKHSEYVAFNEAVQNAKTAVETISANEIPGDVGEKLKTSIDYFYSILSKFTDSEDKGQKKLRYAAYFNLAYIYYTLENFDKALEMSDLLVKNDYDIKDGERLIKQVNEIKEDLQKHSLTTRHFIPPCEDASAPE
jgi:hypothetical protein